MRLLSLILFALGALLLMGAFIAWRHDRDQLANWDRVTAIVDSATVRPIQPTGLNRGRWVPVLYMTWTHNGKTYQAGTWEPMWARRTRERAKQDAEAAKRAGKEEILVDPYEEYHISARPNDAVYYYRDAWQRALLGLALLGVGIVLRTKNAATSG